MRKEEIGWVELLGTDSRRLDRVSKEKKDGASWNRVEDCIQCRNCRLKAVWFWTEMETALK